MSKQAFQDYYQNLLGENEYQQFWEAQNAYYPKAWRVNTLKWSVDDFKSWAKQENWKLKEIPYSKEGFWIDLPEDYGKGLGSSLPHLSGYSYIQGATSMYPVELLDIRAGDRVLDLCASPGGKTTHIAQKLNNSGLVIANEISRNRLPQLKENIARLGIWNAVVTNLRPDYFAKYYPESFDKILVDAPCSGEGMIAKSTEVMNKWSPKYVKGFAKMQVKILKSAFEALKSGGTLVYSTCTLNDIENEGVLEEMKSIYDTFEVKQMKKFWPHKDNSEGFFASVIYKQPLESDPEQKRNINLKKKLSPAKQQWQILTRNKQKKVWCDFATALDFVLPSYIEGEEGIYLLRYQDKIWMQSGVFWNEFSDMSVKQVGLPLAKCHPNDELDYLSCAANCFGHLFAKNLSLSNEVLEQFLCSNEILGEYGDEGFYGIYKRPLVLGLGKVSKGRLKRI